METYIAIGEILIEYDDLDDNYTFLQSKFPVVFSKCLRDSVIIYGMPIVPLPPHSLNCTYPSPSWKFKQLRLGEISDRSII